MTHPTPKPKPPRTRARRWGRRIGWGSVALVVLAGALLFWLLATAGGRDTLLTRVLGLLPPDSLQWDRVEGTVAGPLVFHDLRYDHDGVVFTAKRVLLDPRVLPVLGRRLQLDRLEVDQALLQLPPAADEPFVMPSWPDSLPRLALPLQINATQMQVDALRIQRGADALIAITRIDASGVQLSDDGFSVASLALASDRGNVTLQGDYLPSRQFRTDLAGTLAIAATDTAPAATLQFNAKGDLTRLRVDVAGKAPQPLALSLMLDGPAALPVWNLKAHSDGLQPALLGLPAAEPWQFRLAADGRGGQANVEGELAQGDWRVTLLPSRLALESQVLRAQPLELALPQGPLTITGELQLDGDASRFDAIVASTGFVWKPESSEPGALAVTAAGQLHASGDLQDWALDGNATLERAGELATVQVVGTGDQDGLRLSTLRADTPTGSLDGSGTVRWTPTLAFELDAALSNFDPGYFAPDYPGALSGRLQASADQQADGRWQGRADLPSLTGQLRERPVSGSVSAQWAGDRGTGDASLRIGESLLQVKGGFGARYDLDAHFEPLVLSDVVADAQGRVQGTVSLHGPVDALNVSAQLQGQSLRWGDQQADTLSLAGTLPASGGAGRLEARLSGAVVSGLAVDSLDVLATGSQSNLQLDAKASGPRGAIDLAARIARTAKQWRGRIASLRIAATKAPALVLESGGEFVLGPDVLRVEPSCLVIQDAGGRLCITATGNDASLQAQSIPLALAQPWLGETQGLSFAVDGTVDATVQLRRGDSGWRGTGRVVSPQGVLRLAEDLEREVFGYRDLLIDLQLNGDALSAELTAALADDGSVSARIRTGLSDTASLGGDLVLDVRDLTWLELFSQDVAAPVGRLDGQLLLAGTRAAPELSGQAQLKGFAAELPALGVKLADGEFSLLGNADGTSRLQGAVRSGNGLLRVDGSLNFRDATAPLRLVLSGENVTLASTPELYLIATPELTLRWLPDRLELRGTLNVPEARADLEALDSSVSASPDVVVLDPIDAAREQSNPLDMDFLVSLGDKVKLKGFGLDGAITGALRLRESPGRRATAIGTLEVTGKYRAYGQKLTIQRARLSYVDSPFDNPTLDIRAERDFDNVTVGVQVRGTANRPETTVISSPAMETSEALAWLVFGRPLSTTTAGENQQLGAAALALGAGGNLVAQQLGASLGLDEAGVTESRNLGGATFTIGKYVLPRLFLSYGVSLVGTGQVVTLKYLLRRGFDISVESGNESAASLNWRTER